MVRRYRDNGLFLITYKGDDGINKQDDGQTKTKAHFYLTCFAQIEGKMCYLLRVSQNMYDWFSKQ